MKNEEFVNKILEEMKKTMPPKLHDENDVSIKGENAIIGTLHFFKNGLSSGELSQKLDVSTARIAAAVNNLEYKGFVKRKIDSVDKRKIIVSLTEDGDKRFIEFENNLRKRLLLITNELGQEKVKEYIETMKQIKDILERNDK
jgi:MarR family transcriptional regulator, organic hydroperoxide resistance regulator